MALTDLTPIFGLPNWALAVILIWSLIWKGFALWKSARLNQKIWFVVLFIINLFGIPEILYIFVFSKMKFNHLTSKNSGR